MLIIYNYNNYIFYHRSIKHKNYGDFSWNSYHVIFHGNTTQR
jgi:hypothetical protein